MGIVMSERDLCRVRYQLWISMELTVGMSKIDSPALSSNRVDMELCKARGIGKVASAWRQGAPCGVWESGVWGSSPIWGAPQGNVSDSSMILAFLRAVKPLEIAKEKKRLLHYMCLYRCLKRPTCSVALVIVLFILWNFQTRPDFQITW